MECPAMVIRFVTLTERPELAVNGIPSEQVWPEYNLHGDVTRLLWPRLYDDLSDFQFGLYDADTDELLAEGHTAPCWWDGAEERLSTGIDATLLDAFTGSMLGIPSTRCAPWRLRSRLPAGDGGWRRRFWRRCGRSPSGPDWII
jgi:hypothetical protein